MIKILDYGIGNIQSFINLFKRIGVLAGRANSESSIHEATHLILPGVGHFDRAMEALNASGLRPTIEKVISRGDVNLLGVCVGMQMLADSSEEGTVPGLGWIPGKVKSFKSNLDFPRLPLPHMGWNQLVGSQSRSGFLDELDNNHEFYFLHSFYFEAASRSDVLATSQYGFDFDSFVSRGNVHGVQFHPEKSHQWGEYVLKKFTEL